MNFGLQASSQDRPAKKQAVGGTSKDLNQILLVVAKLCLSNAQTSRMLKAILIDCSKLDSSTEEVVSMKEATKSFAVTAKELREDKGLTAEAVRAELATPAVHAFNALLAATFKNLKADGSGEEDPRVVAFRDYYQSKGIQELARFVKHCKAVQMFDKKHTRLEMHIAEVDHHKDHPEGLLDPKQMYDQIVKPHLVTRKGFVPLAGMAPAGDLERQIQDWLGRN
jgi:hypothetical protein